MIVTIEWLDEKFETIKKMQEEIDERIEQLKRQQLINYGAIAMINEMRKEVESEKDVEENNTF
tara:strand:- start:178 stop:366 length:189 start_codon:yes stop_codon:yes gene_type:complete